MYQRPVQEFLRTLDDRHWIIGDELILTRKTSSDNCSWYDGQGSFFNVKKESQATQMGEKHSDFPIVYEVGLNSGHIVWRIGDAFLKLVIPHSRNVTQEHDTIVAIKKILPDTFVIPQVLFHGEWDGRYYLATTKVPGVTLHEAWPRMSEDLKSKCVRYVTDLCTCLAQVHGPQISGIDGNHLTEWFLLKDDGTANFAPSILMENSKELGMDCSTLCLYHCDLTPGNIIANLEAETFGIIDWECVGFVPREWIKTKFCVSGSMNLNVLRSNEDDSAYNGEWKSRMQQSLMQSGFNDVVDSFFKWNSL